MSAKNMRRRPLCLRVGGSCNSFCSHRRMELSPAQKKRVHATLVSEHCASARHCHRQCAGFVVVQAVGNRPPGALYPSSPPKNRTRAPRDNALLPAIGKLCRLGGDNEKKFCDIDVHAGIAGSGAVGLQVQRCKAGDGLPVHAVRRRRRAEALDQASRAGFDGNGNSCAGRYASGVRQKPGIKPGLTPDQL